MFYQRSRAKQSCPVHRDATEEGTDLFVHEINYYVWNITGAILFSLGSIFLLTHVAGVEK